ncbi:hypothetical protein [Oligella urethralis]|uniref:hypothetical protein n=1 Tax=Oligella urethralis TaxID=90245 RepID=UPI001788E57F|nr:hypothetical protein [Oligella urethralis]
MKKILVLSMISIVLTGCATHKPAPEPNGAFFPINTERLVPVYEQIGEAENAVQKEK